MENRLQNLDCANISSIEAKDEIDHVFKVAKIRNLDNVDGIAFRMEDFSPYDYSKKGHLDNTTNPDSRIVSYYGRP